MDLKLRHAAPADYRQTEWITREAFWNQYAPGCVEHYLLHIMRGSPAFVHELDLAAFLGEELVGSVAFVRGTIQGDDGRDHPVLTLGPISVLPRHQGGRRGSDHPRQGAGPGTGLWRHSAVRRPGLLLPPWLCPRRVAGHPAGRWDVRRCAPGL